MGFEPTRSETNGLSFHRLNHSAIFFHKRCDQSVFLYVNFKSTNFHFLVVLKFSIIKNIFTCSCQDFIFQSVSYVPITQNFSASSPVRITWSLFSTMSSAVFEEICSKVTSNPKHRIAGNLSQVILFLSKFSKKVVAEIFKIPVFSEI